MTASTQADSPSPVSAAPLGSSNACLREFDGTLWTGIENVDYLPPFLATMVGDNDLWLYAGSNGALCAGRREPDLAFFPYVTVDKLLEQARNSGALTVLRLTRGNGTTRVWEPWAAESPSKARRRTFLKHPEGNGLCFEERDGESGLVFKSELASCAEFGLVRRCSLKNDSGAPVATSLLDGWHKVLPPCFGVQMWERLSYLTLAYMRHDRVPGLPLGVFSLNAAITDRAEAREIQRAAVAWSAGLGGNILLSTRQLETFRAGGELREETEIRGDAGAFLTEASFDLSPGEEKTWWTCVDTNLDHPALFRLKDFLERERDPGARLAEGVRDDRRRLGRRLSAADGREKTARPASDLHHLSNTLFNVMRGGILPSDLRVTKKGFESWLERYDRPVAERTRAARASWPETLGLEDLDALAAQSCDRQLQRLSGLYLPLTFSRRHGDPSRPWNRFSIRLTDDDGSPLSSWQGNWRDIFQNWEALALSFPSALPRMVNAFLDASSADGYNPYRITSDGIEWEVPEPSDPWSHLGYWGDHQIVYLERLLAMLERCSPGWICRRINEERHACSDIPYVIGDFDRILRDPHDTITFDEEAHRRALRREKEFGADARMIPGDDGLPRLFSLGEKLLVPVLAKLSNFVPEGGVWLNTQRPEWNDANNALVGRGLSMVTVYQLRRHLALLSRIFSGEGELRCTGAAATFLNDIAEPLADMAGRTGWSAGERFRAVEALGRAGERHRKAVYERRFGATASVPLASVRRFLADALSALDASIRSNRREDGLYHSYNLLVLDGGKAEVTRLHLMLEGQVNVLACGLLSGAESAVLLEALRRSELYRADQNSYLLYPDRKLLPFLERNTLPRSAAEKSTLVNTLLRDGDRSLVVASGADRIHFAPDIDTHKALSAALDRLESDARYTLWVARERPLIESFWEDTFHHRSFLGRSGTMFAFEGLGSIYWHMVAKLLLSVQETYFRSLASGEPPERSGALAAKYYEIRAGLGASKTPARFGAFPTDPYSHTPAHKGAQQPGMTGQVKEELVARRGELGVAVENGCLAFRPNLLRADEFATEAGEFLFTAATGADRRLRMPAQSLAFTLCQTPVLYLLEEENGITVEYADGKHKRVFGLALSEDDTALILRRTNRIALLRISLRPEDCLPENSVNLLNIPEQRRANADYGASTR